MDLGLDLALGSAPKVWKAVDSLLGLALFPLSFENIQMEWFLSLFIFHDAYVVSFLVLAIAILVVMLLIFNHKSPQSVVDNELNNSRGVEEALRRVLEDKSIQNVVTDSNVDNEDFEKLKEEVLNKDRAIAELNKKLTQSSGVEGAGSAASGESEELTKKIADLEAQLKEYELIEDDIADLSTYRAENAKLKETLAELKSKLGEDASEESTVPQDADDKVTQSEAESEAEVAPAASSDGKEPEEPEESDLAEPSNQTNQTKEAEQIEQEEAVSDEPTPSPVAESSNESTLTAGSSDESTSSIKVEGSGSKESVTSMKVEGGLGQEELSAEAKASGDEPDDVPAKEEEPQEEDLVSAFEKVVSQQEQIPENKGEGETSVAPNSSQVQDSLSDHPKLKGLKPDSKEEADVFISELKSLRKGS